MSDHSESINATVFDGKDPHEIHINDSTLICHEDDTLEDSDSESSTKTKNDDKSTLYLDADIPMDILSVLKSFDKFNNIPMRKDVDYGIWNKTSIRHPNNVWLKTESPFTNSEFIQHSISVPIYSDDFERQRIMGRTSSVSTCNGRKTSCPPTDMEKILLKQNRQSEVIHKNNESKRQDNKRNGRRHRNKNINTGK